MRTLAAFGTAVLLVVSVSCANTRELEKPCAQCVEGVATVKKNVERRVFCVVNGRQVDCTKNPPECPKCAQMLR
jgi:hypothetical protein